MFKAWVCIIMAFSPYAGSSNGVAPALSTIGDIARREDCERIGNAAIRAFPRISGQTRVTFQCVEMIHTPE